MENRRDINTSIRLNYSSLELKWDWKLSPCKINVRSLFVIYIEYSVYSKNIHGKMNVNTKITMTFALIAIPI